MTSDLTPLDTLLKVGIGNARAIKALAATGGSAKTAANWILNHVNDPDLDAIQDRLFVIHLCPTGLLMDQLWSFWEAAKTKTGWNGALKYHPHLTLVTEFACPDERVDDLLNIVTKEAQTFAAKQSTLKIQLEPFTSESFLSLRLSKASEESFRLLSEDLASRFSSGLNVEARSVWERDHALQISLAYQFQAQHLDQLKELASQIEVTAPADWQLRVYSFEERLRGQDVMEAQQGHTGLDKGDLVSISVKEAEAAERGQVHCLSLTTGCSGYIPIHILEQTSKSKAWTLHTSVPVLTRPQKRSPGEILDDIVAGSLGVSSQNPSNKKPRRIIVARHGERVDFVFENWINLCFDANGVYTPRDLNLPLTLPAKKAGPTAYNFDSPLTNVGRFQGRMLGEAMAKAGCTFGHVFCSPALRCLETAKSILIGMGAEADLKLNVEPGLFEWIGFYRGHLPIWLSPTEVNEAGFNINLEYKPYISSDEIQNSIQESCEQHYTRNFFVAQCIAQATEEEGGDILIVAHAASLDTCTRQMTGHQPRSHQDMFKILPQVSYCSVAAIEQVVGTNGQPSWTLTDPPCSTLKHTGNNRFDWTILQEPVNT